MKLSRHPHPHSRLRNGLRQQAGVAIITAVVIAGLVAAIAAFMGWQYQLWLRQVENQHDLAQARIVAYGAINLARHTLQSDARNNGYDHAGEPWAIPIPRLPVERGFAGGTLTDVQGRFNLNNLMRGNSVSEVDVASLRQLLRQLSLNEDLANALVDWIDGDSEVRYPGGAEDMDYLGQDPPYRAANQKLTDLASLERIKGFTLEIVAKLQPWVVVLPEPTPVNLNFAPAEVISSVLPGITLAEAQSLVQHRQNSPFTSLEDVRQLLSSAQGNAIDSSRVSVSSQYFQIDATAQFGRVNVAYRALLERRGDSLPAIIWMERR